MIEEREMKGGLATGENTHTVNQSKLFALASETHYLASVLVAALSS